MPAVQGRMRASTAETKATITVIPDPEFRSGEAPSKCIGGGEAKMEVVSAKAY